MVSIEFSTPFVDHGPEFRRMVVELATSVSFSQPEPLTDGDGGGPTRPSVADLLRG